MKLELGKTYRHSDPASKSRFRIEAQWSSNLFEGRCIGPNGNSSGYSYMFNIAGEALGWRGNQHKATLGWRLCETVEEYEYILIYEGHLDNRWTTLSKTSPRVFYSGSKYLVRKKDNHASTEVYTVDELRALQAKL